MIDVTSNQFWENEFGITQADLDRLHNFIEKQAVAQDLTHLIKRVVRGRLRYGAELHSQVMAAAAVSQQIRLWNPSAAWAVGDFVIALRRVNGELVSGVGEIVEQKHEEVQIFFASEQKHNKFQLRR